MHQIGEGDLSNKVFLFEFLAAKRSSTRALVLCLSVCLSVSKLNFSLFGQLMTTYDTF